MPLAASAHKHERNKGDEKGGFGDGDATPRQPQMNSPLCHPLLPSTTTTTTNTAKAGKGNAACPAGEGLQVKQEPGKSGGAGGVGGQPEAPDVLALVRPVRTGLRGQRRVRGNQAAVGFDEGVMGPGAGKAIEA
eukprot:scaffold126159_cov17-Tisochrysis_lutea.AAC.1